MQQQPLCVNSVTQNTKQPSIAQVCGTFWSPAMPHIDNDLKLDFKDVLLRPKRSTLKSRSEVDLTRSFSFRNSKQMYTGIPIIAANMDTVGTFEMAKVLCKVGLPHTCYLMVSS
ncbi:GMP reductase 2 [Fukomys damarensis]|nr:GMP reductase 2 [Fukomys damarensis]